MKRAVLNSLVILALLLTSVSVVGASSVAQDSTGDLAPVSLPNKSPNNIYIVQLAEMPVVAYTGDIQGFARTKPQANAKVDTRNPDVVRYAGYLNSRHDAVIASVGGTKLYDYQYSYNGFAAVMSEGQAAALRNVPGVLAVSPDQLVNVDTSSTPSFLGLDAEGGLWARLGGVGSAGEDIVIGVIDSGIWPESASFSDLSGYSPLAGWRVKCSTGEQFTAANCNNKLVGAQYFNAAWGGDAGIEAQRPWEFTSPRDYNGHGTHTAGTAGGNNGVPATGPAAVFGDVSGIAPRARISAYKALWSTQDGATASGFNSDLVAAIDKAVADGVDVINYSVSGTSTNFLDPVEISFLFAADAGVFVAASAGNSGPTASTVAHPSPWITTVAAGTHNRNGVGSVTLGDGATYNGASLASATGPAPLIDSTAAGLPGADPTALALCFTAGDNGGTPVLDPALVAGKIVVCDRGVNARVNKSLAVQQAGGVGMILVNTSANSMNADLHFVPTVHLSHLDRAAVKAYAATAGATATINQSAVIFTEPAPFTAAFSSRGPLTAGGGDLLKPDLIAPGQDILAAVAPPGQAGLDFNILSGTSMSSPHVAGLAALMKDLHPSWSPTAIKSALMTSAYDVLDGPNSAPGVIFSQGAGHVQPNVAANPGLVYDSNIDDWLAFLCGATSGVNPAVCAALAGAGFSLDPSDMNVASIAIGNMAGIQTVTRRVTNVGRPGTYTPSVSGLDGIDVVVSPSSMTLAKGETKSFTVTFTRTSAPLNAYVGGQLTWSDGTNNVRIPLVIRPVALGAPAQVNGTGDPINYDVTFGYDGPFTATGRGLVPATVTAGSVSDDPGDSFTPGGPGTTAFPVVIPAGTTYVRFSLFDSDVTPPSDLDLYVVQGASTIVGVSGSGTSQEEVNFTFANPTAGAIPLTVYVHGFAVPGTANFNLYNWYLGTADAGNMTVSAPATATTGDAGTISLTFSGLAPATKYLGSVAYGGTTGMPNPTIVRVDTP